MPIKRTDLFSLKSVCLFVLLHVVMGSCTSSRAKKEIVLFETYCASCHLAPSIQDLPRELWKNNILPEMGARLGIQDPGYSPYTDLSMGEQYSIIETGVYPSSPLIKPEDWALLKAYILEQAPDSLPAIQRSLKTEALSQFSLRTLALDSTKGSLITFLEMDDDTNMLVTGDLSGRLASFDFESGTTSFLGRYGRGITSYATANGSGYVTSVGNLDPSEIASGRLFKVRDSLVHTLPHILHRPVHTTVHDFNGDGKEELVVSEFGDLKGELSIFHEMENGEYRKEVLLAQAGTLRTLVKDMDADGRDDLLVLTTQGDESITILYQKESLQFVAEKAIRFSPVYGTSWFEMADYEGDGDMDIITVHGDNADKSYAHKPYHGMRIHLNDGNANFEEVYFFPMYGATRVIASDFDHDGDMDFSLLSTFPDYARQPDEVFVYLENRHEASFSFQPQTTAISDLGNWFLMSSGDLDRDGDEDLVLSSFTYYFAPVPDSLRAQWSEHNTDILILENRRNPNGK